MPKDWTPGVVATPEHSIRRALLKSPAGWKAPWRIDSTSRCRPSNNQGNHPSCAGWASSNHAEERWWAETHVPIDYDGLITYNEAKRIDGAPREDGTDGVSAMQAAINLRQLPSTSGALPAKGWTPRYTADFEEVRFFIHRFHTCVLLLNIRSGWDRCKDTGQIPGGGDVLGGHAVLGHLYVDKDRLGVQNQWPDWGIDGNGWLAWDDAQEQFFGAVIAEPVPYPYTIGQVVESI